MAPPCSVLWVRRQSVVVPWITGAGAWAVGHRGNLEFSKSLQILRFHLTPAQHLGKTPKCNFFPFVLNFFQKWSFYSVVCGESRMGAVPFAAGTTMKRALVNSRGLPSLPSGRSAGDITVGIIYHAALCVPNLQAVANLQRQQGNKLHFPKRKTVTTPPFN